jgi:Putative restriction endonuclease
MTVANENFDVNFFLASLLRHFAEAHDLGRVFGEPFQMKTGPNLPGGVREHWLIDPQRKQAEFYQRAENGFYRPISTDETGTYHSQAMPGLWIKVEWLWQEPLPQLLTVLREWKLI